MSRIKELPKSSSHLLSCTQVITSVQSVVKELLENALDSHATSVEIKLENFGLEKIEIKDNGGGILKDDIQFVAKPHCTSKITSHLDLTKINTYGFRGEALAAICAVADLEITTKTANEEFGYTYTFDHNGNILSSKPCPCNQGTIVLVKNLFNNMPVRKQLYRAEKKKKEIKMVEDILIAFGCILTRIRFVFYHNRNLIWQKSIVDKAIDGLRLALGNVVDYMENCEYVDEETQIKIEVFLPKCNASPVCGQTSSSRSIVAVNKRPVRIKCIDKLLKEYYCKSMGDGQKSRYPVCFISIEVPTAEVDVNLEPNKTTVLLHNMDIISEQLHKLLSSFYDTSANIEANDQSKNISNVTSPIHTDDKIEKVSSIHNISNIVNKENGTSNFLLNHLNIAGGQNNKPKENIVVSKKLSRKIDFQTPSSKKVKTSSFSTPPNDIHRHINTLEAFFSSENKSNDFCSDGQNSEIPNKNGMNSENSCLRNENIFSDQNSMSATVQRKTDNANDDVLVLDSLNGTPKKNMAETIVENSSFFHRTSEVLNNDNKISKDSCSFNNVTSCDDQTESLKFNGTNKGSFVSALSIINKERNQELQSMDTNKNLASFEERPLEVQKSKSNLDSNGSDPSAASNWSRGLHPTENIQPVAVLKPKVVGIDVPSDEARNSVEQIEIQEPCVESVIQRKITPFDFFCRKHRLEVASLNPELNSQQIAQILSEKWNCLSSEEKAVYKNMVSKDYPKNVKNKEKLGKIVEENISKIKNNSLNSRKSTRKKRRKRIEKNITFDLQLLQECSLNTSLEKEHDENFKIINCLAPGIWICCKKEKLYLLNSYRLQEAIIYFRLLNTYEFEAEQIESSFILTSSSLGDHSLDVLLQMEVINEYGSEYISDKRLTANGFKMKILRGNNEIQVELIGMTNSMAFYGVSDLKEILYLIKEKGLNAKLSECRPGKVVLYLQGEAVRIARQSPASKKIEDIEDLLKQIDSLPFQTCLHSKPFLHELHELNTI
ncbi:PMS1 protein like protein [Argiope bruennichi]|uniref:PMS1 protein like protein n=1 Tax=Argiope bruennichi TaxID=94029 RepID=A0A8T0FND4_ARGBR|nr:PMS1 protein like protein [Argiope bruennichi]